MPSYADDPRHQRLVAALPALLARTCPQGGGGYGGAYELRLTDDEIEDLGGLDLLRSALRAAARKVGWSKIETYGVPTAYGGLAGVVDRREIPEEFADAVERHRQARMRAAVETVARNRADRVRRAVPGSVTLTTQEFRAALAAVPQG